MSGYADDNPNMVDPPSEYLDEFAIQINEDNLGLPSDIGTYFAYLTIDGVDRYTIAPYSVVQRPDGYYNHVFKYEADLHYYTYWQPEPNRRYWITIETVGVAKSYFWSWATSICNDDNNNAAYKLPFDTWSPQWYSSGHPCYNQRVGLAFELYSQRNKYQLMR